MVKIGVVGHRFLESETTKKFVTNQCMIILEEAQRKYKDVIALSAIAEGADIIFAETALLLKIVLHTVKPFKKYINDFEKTSSKHRYINLQQKAKKQIELPYINRSEKAYYEAMQWVLNNSDILVAIWDGKEMNTKAGTAAAVKQVIANNNAWIHIDVSSLSTKFYRCMS